MFHPPITTNFTPAGIWPRTGEQWTNAHQGSGSRIAQNGAGKNARGAEVAARSKKLGRFGNVKKTKLDGHTFASGTEAARYLHLRGRELGGEISSLKLQPRYKIQFAGKPVLMRSKRYPNGRVLTYVADFSYIDPQKAERIIEDVKMASGHRTEIYKIKKALMEAMGYKVKEV